MPPLIYNLTKILYQKKNFFTTKIINIKNNIFKLQFILGKNKNIYYKVFNLIINIIKQY